MKNWLSAAAMVVVLVFATAGWAVNIETIPVGDPNNDVSLIITPHAAVG